MTKTVVIVGSLDTKGTELSWVKERIERRGLRTKVVDVGVLGEPAFAPDISAAEVARAGGEQLQALREGQHKDLAMRVMASGSTIIVRRLYDAGLLDGILSMGGGGGTSIATSAMRSLPIGVPKLMVSTLAGGDVSEFAGTSDITFMPSVVDVAGLNRISRRIFANAVGAIVGMVTSETAPTAEDKPLIAASMFGNTTPCVERSRLVLEEAGYEVLVFHATGTGGRTMERLIDEGHFAASLDITTTELADYVCGGVLSAGSERCLAASRSAIPAVLVPGCVDMANFRAIETVPERYKERTLYRWNPNVTLLRTSVDENRCIGEMIAAAANAALAPVTILLPLRGVSMLDSEGGPFWEPAADRSCFDAIKASTRSDVCVTELDLHINDHEFADTVASVLLEMLAEWRD